MKKLNVNGETEELIAKRKLRLDASGIQRANEMIRAETTAVRKESFRVDIRGEQAADCVHCCSVGSAISLHASAMCRSH